MLRANTRAWQRSESGTRQRSSRVRVNELVSVVMPVHNALPYLDAAIESIIGQTYREIEFVIYDDGSTDGSSERLREWAGRDTRIKLFPGAENLGPAVSSNHVVRKASAELIARMDADDISHPERIAREVELLRQRPEVGLVASLCEIMDSQGARLRDPEVWRLKRHAWFAPFAHGSIMFRRSLFDRIGGYRGACEFWEDQDLVLRMAAEAEVMVIPRELYRHRQSTVSTRVASDPDRVERAVDLMYRCMGRLDEQRGYDDLLGAHADAKIDPRVFISLGSLYLWAGSKPRMFRRLLRRGRLGADLRTASALVWTAWASASPSTLRGFLRVLHRIRNASASVDSDVAVPVRWKPPEQPLISPAGRPNYGR